MKRRHPLPKLVLVALAALFSGLLLSTAVVPTVMSATSGKVVATPMPVEEEQMHGRTLMKSTLQDHRSWDGNAVQLSERIRANFRDRDEALPVGPISDVALQPPKGA